MDNKTLIKTHILADIPLLITGKSGWGKTAIVNQVAKELNMPIIDLPLSQIPAEDLMGIPNRNDNGYFEYLMPEWAHKILESNQETILFLDEITQASVSVLHACFRLVNERVVCGKKLPIHIVAATNYDYENPELTELMEPLQRRFSRVEWEHDKQAAMAYLNIRERGYDESLVANALETTSPRELELALKFIDVNCKNGNLQGFNKIIIGMTSQEMCRALQTIRNKKESLTSDTINAVSDRFTQVMRQQYPKQYIPLSTREIQAKVNRIAAKFSMSEEEKQACYTNAIEHVNKVNKEYTENQLNDSKSLANIFDDVNDLVNNSPLMNRN